MDESIRPKVRFLSDEAADRVIDEALELLGTAGVFLEDETAFRLIEDAGQRVDRPRKRAFIGRALVEACLKTAPSEVRLYGLQDGKEYLIGGDEVHFVPGSAAVRLLDPETMREREPVTSDLADLYRLVETLEHIDLQSTALVSADVPREVADCYRLYLGLLIASKPFITGIFRAESLSVMLELLEVVRGGSAALEARPAAVFDACPSSPLQWSGLTARSLVECARRGVPSGLVAMAMAGATSPVTLAGTLVQHTAENLAGLVIAQLARPGAPVIFGGSSAVFDMHKGTAPLGAVETQMLACASSQVGKRLNLPTHYYIGLSDSKLVDCQAGLETAAGAVLAGLAGINVVSGPGMLDLESTQSLEKLVIDNDICGHVRRLLAGVALRERPLALHLFGPGTAPQEFLTSPHTRQWHRAEQHTSAVIDRDVYGTWLNAGGKDAFRRAREEAAGRLAAYQRPGLEPEKARELGRVMAAYARQAGCEALPRLEPSRQAG
jgi:trimethylamine--corrinoid protein Co-methyltransferase